jgi:RNA polymerase sigma factor (sigma-70 family)
MGDERGLNALIESHQRRLFGFFRARVGDDETARDLVQDTWAELWRRAETFDPDRGSFWTFTKIWAAIVLKRHWDDVRARREESATLDRSCGPSDSAEAGVEGLGEAHASTAEERVDVVAALLELLCFVNVCFRPPHEVIVFGFSKLKWRPSEIVEELAGRRLDELAARLEDDYRTVVPMPAIPVAFCPLRGRLAYPLGHLVADPRTRRAYTRLLPRVVGGTTLEEYFPAGRSAEAVVTQWWDTVKRAVFNEVRRAGRGALFRRLQAECAAAPAATAGRGAR